MKPLKILQEINVPPGTQNRIGSPTNFIIKSPTTNHYYTHYCVSSSEIQLIKIKILGDEWTYFILSFSASLKCLIHIVIFCLDRIRGKS